MIKIDIEKKTGDFHLNLNIKSDNKKIALLGASGSGKSMTLRCIAGLEKPDSGIIENNGKIYFDSFSGINISAKKRKVGFIFQNYALFPHMTVYENIAFGLSDIDKKIREERIYEELSKVCLTGYEKRYPHQLSGGQQQRVAIARTMALKPELILLDEPFSALDKRTRDIVINEMGNVLENYKGRVIFVTHNIDEAYRLCNEIVVIADGEEETGGERDEIFKNPPTAYTAEITGCKNIFEASCNAEGKIFIHEIGLEIYNTGKIKEGKILCGIRAHHVSIGARKRNTVDCIVEYVNIGPFSVTVFFKPVSTPDGKMIQCEIGKKEWEKIEKTSGIYSVYLNPEYLFFMQC